MRIYDTLTATKKEFEPLGSPVKIYFCGLTPKNYPHIGHAKTFVTADVMRRYLRHLGYDVLYLQNFTDIDDKTIARAEREGVTYKEVADRYTRAYFENMDALGVQRADRYPKATDAIPAIIRVVEGLIEKGYGYAVGGNVYYRVDHFPAYGRLSKRAAGDNQAGAGLRTRKPLAGAVEAAAESMLELAEVDTGLERDEQLVAALAAGDDEDMADAVDAATAAAEKERPADFALWKAAKPGEPSWESPWGPGRPAWHIECTTMIFEELGERIDIHGGGADLIFPHHENEIAQSEAASGLAPFVGYWVHIALLNIMTPEGAKKMAHSGTFTAINDILARYEPGVLRLYLLSQHYRTPATYDGSVLEDTARAWERLRAVYTNRELLRNWPPYRDVEAAEPVDVELTKAGRKLRGTIPSARAAFRAGMDDDFNTSQGVAALFDLVADTNRLKDGLSSPRAATPTAKGLAEAAFAAIDEIMGVLGLPHPEVGHVVVDGRTVYGTDTDTDLASRVERLLAERERLREARDFDGADRVRDELVGLGLVVEDHPQGKVWRRKR